MKYTTQFFTPFLLMIFFLLPNVGSAQLFKTFKKGQKYEKKGQYEKAEQIFKKKENHRVWKTGVEYYRSRRQAEMAHTLPQYIELHQKFCELDSSWAEMGKRKERRLRRKGITPDIFRQISGGLEMRALGNVQASNSVFGADSLLRFFPCWEKNNIANRDTIIQTVVHNNLPTENYCIGNIINKRLLNYVQKDKYSAIWAFQDNTWSLFTSCFSYCDMDTFRLDYPENKMATDCWFDTAKAVLCRQDIHELLVFHNTHIYTPFEEDIIENILLANSKDGLSEAEIEHVADLLLYFITVEQLKCKSGVLPDSLLLSNVLYYSEKYTPRPSAYILVKLGSEYFAQKNEITTAIHILEKTQLIFPDTNSCDESPWNFQIDKQPWFSRMTSKLKEYSESEQPMVVKAWDDPEHWEYNAISYADGKEVLFVRENPNTHHKSIMRSIFVNENWTTPKPVRQLMINNQMEVLSFAAEGRVLLLRSGQNLYTADRRDTSMLWKKPERMPIPLEYANQASLSPDAKTLLVVGSTESVSARKRPVMDIYKIDLNPSGKSASAEALPEPINTTKNNEDAPLLFAQGQMLAFTSDQYSSYGGKDIYLVRKLKLDSWEHWGTPENYGPPICTLFDDENFTFLIDKGGTSYFNKTLPCGDGKQIWALPTKGYLKDEAKKRYAGIVLDKHTKKPITYGFAEVLSDGLPEFYGSGLDDAGRFAYKLPKNTHNWRVHIKAGGYYSESEVRYRNATPNTQFDTIYLESFSDLQEHFTLQYATFASNESGFEDNRVFNELARAANIANRMGAYLRIIGHSDNRGTEQHKSDISMERARTAQDFLVQHCNFPIERTLLVSAGYTQPKCDGDSHEALHCNRRVEIEFDMRELKPKSENGISLGVE